MQNRKRDTDVQNRLLDSVGEGEGGMFQDNSIETCIVSRVKQITSPGGMHETSAGALGKTQRNWVEREVGGGIGMGNTCKSMADSCQCMTKTTTIKKKKKKKKSPCCWERLKAGGEGKTEDEMVGWHHRLSGHELGKLQETVKDREALRAAVPWGHRVGHD